MSCAARWNETVPKWRGWRIRGAFKNLRYSRQRLRPPSGRIYIYEIVYRRSSPAIRFAFFARELPPSLGCVFFSFCRGAPSLYIRRARPSCFTLSWFGKRWKKNVLETIADKLLGYTSILRTGFHRKKGNEKYLEGVLEWSFQIPIWSIFGYLLLYSWKLFPLWYKVINNHNILNFILARVEKINYCI